MQIIHAKRGDVIPLGREGENLARQVVFDIYEWQEMYGDGNVQLLAQRMGDPAPYPCVIEMDGNHAVWNITNADTARPGKYGKCELSYFVGETLVKSETFVTIVLDALGEPTEEPPEPYQDWVNKVLAAGANAETAADRAETAAVRQPTIGENGNWWVWDATAGEYVDTGVAAAGGDVPIDWFGEGVELPDTCDLADYKTNGKYYATKGTKENKPAKCKPSFTMFVYDAYHNVVGIVKQRLIIDNYGKIFTCNIPLGSSSKLVWVEYATKDELDSALQEYSTTAETLAEIYQAIDNIYWSNIKGKPFSEVMGAGAELLTETTIDIDGNIGGCNVDFVLIPNHTYYVAFDGTEYELVAERFESSVALGNDVFSIEQFDDSQDWFEIYAENIDFGSATLSVKDSTTVNTINSECLPAETWTFTLEDGTVIEKKVVVAE